MQTIYWLVLFVILLIIEILTMGLTTIWFAAGALAAFLAGWLGEGVVLTFLLIVLLGGTGWIFLYSFLVYKRIMK